ncbi:LytR C-terminal domain-containing protein [Massilia sp. R2A-15]|uniref:LytR C-terminal domain-containing protein n=1 Tax=Massilia sp. R2A-15 TaxID=3064278 RepID=UPI002736453A|nr:LytR C-terminal domain-containing protein [Massilia sp. R2A-15]WLI89213.1 LytR C-terminal domain-containing protein [Massilia sp. R2A-15]
MQPTLKYLSAACAGALLMACADVGQRTAPAAVQARAGVTADDAYLTGRQQQLARQHALAAQSYQVALRIDAAHVNARNGLATLHAEQGDLASAIALWRQLTADPATSGPASAYLFSNLGHAYILSGDYPQAVVALERACMLDPLSQRSWRHLGDALARMGQHERAQLVARQADALERHDFGDDHAPAKRLAGAPGDNAVGAQDTMAQTEVRQTGAGMFELRRTAAPAAIAPVGAPAAAIATVPVAAPALAEAQTAPAQVAPAAARLEIRNGNGVAGMARALAQRMDDAGVRVVRLSNHKGFNVQRTRIEYQAAFRDAATRLAERFGGAEVQQVPAGGAADLRLVIGRDLVRSQADARRVVKAALARAG